MTTLRTAALALLAAASLLLGWSAPAGAAGEKKGEQYYVISGDKFNQTEAPTREQAEKVAAALRKRYDCEATISGPFTREPSGGGAKGEDEIKNEDGDTIRLGKPLGRGGVKQVYTIEGDPERVVGILRKTRFWNPDRGSTFEDGVKLLEEEKGLLERIGFYGLPVVKVHEITKVAGRPAIIMERLAQGSKDVVKTVNGKVKIVGTSPHLNERSIQDLRSIKEKMIAQNVSIDDLQFLIGEDGRIVIADPAGVKPNTPPSRKNRQTIDKLIEAAERSIRTRNAGRQVN